MVLIRPVFTLIGHYAQADFNAENVGGTLAIIDPTVTYTGALTIAAGSTVSAATGNVIAESTVTNGGTFAVLNDNDIEVLGALDAVPPSRPRRQAPAISISKAPSTIPAR